MIIKTTEELEFYINKLRSQEYIAIDTEFMREKTYWPQVCLIQIASGDIAFCVDPLDKEIDLTELFNLLQDSKIIKVFHSARQDIEIFVHLTGKVPVSIFDTQIAAMVCGLGENVSYKDIVFSLLRKVVDKGMRYTDWSKRPLDNRQIEYALSDVTHLCEVYQILKERLENNGRIGWIDEEMQHLSDIKTYVIEPDEAYKRLKVKKLSPQAFGAFRALAGWREAKAKELDKPRGHIIKDTMLHELAEFNPQNVEDLAKIRGISKTGKYNLEIYEAIKKGYENPEKSSVILKKKAPKPLLDMLKLLLQVKAEDYQVASKLIATTDELEKIATTDELFLQGWRHDVFGKFAMELKKGEIAIKYNPETNKVDILYNKQSSPKTEKC